MATPSEPISVLNRRRRNIKGQLTKLSTNLEQNILNSDLDALFSHEEQVIKLSTKFEELKCEYYKIVPDSDIETINKTLEEIDDDISKIEVRLSTSIRKLKNVTDASSHTNPTESKSYSAPKLPDIPLPIFSGKIEEYASFKVQFKNLIDQNQLLSDIDKLYYLRGALRDEAKGIQTLDDSYKSLFEALDKRYDNKRLVIDTHIKAILSFEPIKHESEKELRNLADCIKRNLRALSVLKLERDDLSSAILLNVLLNKLDKDTRKFYEASLTNNEIPDFDDFVLFLERRAQILSTITRGSKPNFSDKSKTFLVKSKALSKSCQLCQMQHPIYQCSKFKDMKLEERYDFCKQNKICMKCLSHPYEKNACQSKGACKICQRANHHTLLHKFSTSNKPSNYNSILPDITSPTQYESQSSLPNQQNTDLVISDSQHSFFSQSEEKCVLINTALVSVRNYEGKFITLRAVLDSASESSFLTFDAANLLGLKRGKTNIPVCGLGDATLSVSKYVSAVISNANCDYQRQINLLIVPRIADAMPSTNLNVSNLSIPKGITLADPKFFLAQKVDLLLGAELFFDFLRQGKIKLSENLYLQESCFGYLVSGTFKRDSSSLHNHCFLSTNLESLNKTLTSFWEIENPFEEENFHDSDELKYCNEHFEKTHFRKPDGRYVVELPLKQGMSEDMLGSSKQMASKRLDKLWNRLHTDSTMKALYSEFLQEYEALGHMTQIKEEDNFEEGYYLPHHGVLKPSSTTTKLRVVFDASAKTTSGFSLNDLLSKGGVIQDDLFSILIRFRKHKYAFTADVKQMFRQIEVAPSQVKLQKILWKDDKHAHTKTFQLNTVTYGTACAPFLATRALKQIALDEGKDFPMAAEVLLRDFYMDDCLSGSSDPQEFQTLKFQLSQLIQKGGMTLHKWQSNLGDTRDSIFPFDRNSDDITVKTLGLEWNSSHDVFAYTVSFNTTSTITKREILSQISRIFDPLGLLGPVITKAKVFMQQLWLHKLNWDQPLPTELAALWKNFVQTLPHIQHIKVPRCVLPTSSTSIRLLGFADASSKAYGCCIYINSATDTNNRSNRLLCSKSRVAPLKNPMTIPRAELSACLLLSKLVQKVLQAFKHEFDCVRLFSDSTIALAWINTAPHLLKTFTSNRVAQIQQLTSEFQWFHISSSSNPADSISRGLDAPALSSNVLWWNGPELASCAEPAPPDPADQQFLEELKVAPEMALITHSVSFLDCFIDRSNNYLKLIRIIAYVYRFIHNCKNHKSNQCKNGPLTREELDNAELVLVKKVQMEYFPSEFAALKKGNSIPVKSKLRFLNPYLDKNEVLRVGGRLDNSDLTFDHKHPMILPSSSKLVKLIFQYYHNRDFHVGPQALLNTIRQKFWPLGGRNTAREIVHKCVTCYKIKPINATQLMGNLPKERVVCNPTFSHVGIDLCGPFHIKYKNQRKGILNKVYVAIFVCMSTKSIHLEFLSDLTSQALIATLKRFFARRGKAAKIFTDNGTNFTGASAELKRLYKMLAKDDEISHFFAFEGIDWCFIPPRTPNHGGLWEAGVKSFKFHFKRVVGNAKLTLEEFNTVMIQIEGILNSRPLTPLSIDTDTFQVLTPGHFLIGRPINSLPEPNLIDTNENLLNRWERLQKMVQTIWKFWKNSYLSHLQQRGKWLFKKQNVKNGMMVILKDSNSPVGKWPLARIINVIPGSDNNVRVVDLKTPTGQFRRAVSKICILPIIDNEETLKN